MVWRKCLGYDRRFSQRWSLSERTTLPWNCCNRKQFCRGKKGENVEYNGFKKRKGIKIHAVVTSEYFPLSIVIGSGAEYDPYRLEEALGVIKIRTGYRPITRPNEIVADSIYNDAQARECCAGEESKHLFQKTKGTERREKEEDPKDLVKNLMRKD